MFLELIEYLRQYDKFETGDKSYQLLIIKFNMDNISRANYMNHPLNNSPSKTAYSFSRSDRFPNLIARYQDYAVTDLSRGYKADPQYERSRQQKYDNNYHNKSRSRDHWDKNRSPYHKPKSKSPSKRVKFQQQDHSPSKRDRSRSPQRHSKRLNTTNQSYNNGQYYPLGVEINKEGKYVVSNYQNVRTASFGRIPKQMSEQSSTILGPGSYDISNQSPGKNNTAQVFSKSPRKGFENTAYNANFGPGMYRTFSQFGNFN